MPQPTNTNATHPIMLDETDSESDLEDGGIPLEVDSMQIDSPNETTESLTQLAGGEIDFIDYGDVGDGNSPFTQLPITNVYSILMNISGSNFLPTAPHPHARPVHHSPAINTDENVQHAARVRTRTREEEHAALCVLDDWELTMTHALNSRRVCLLTNYMKYPARTKRQLTNPPSIRQSHKQDVDSRQKCSHLRIHVWKKIYTERVSQSRKCKLNLFLD